MKTLERIDRQCFGVNCEDAAELIKENGRHLDPLLRISGLEPEVSVLPVLFPTRQLLHERVVDVDEPGLLEVRKSDSPAALQVCDRPVFQDSLQR